MASRFSNLPLRALAVFEAAARHGGFTAAARELAMTQAGVSQHVALLEGELGVALFTRGPRGVAITSAGAALLDSVREGLKILSDGVAATRRQAGTRTIQILTDYGLAAWWLMNRLPAISALLPGVEVRLATTQADLGETDAEFDLAIMFGDGEWAGFRATPFHREEVYPVCAPALLAGRTLPLDPAGIAGMRLLGLRKTHGGRWLGWSDWFAAHGLEPAQDGGSLVFDNAQLLLQATLLGQGVSIGWVPLIDDLVASGSLTKLTGEPLRSTRGYHLVEHSNRARAPHVERLRAWLLAHRAGTPSAPDMFATPAAIKPVAIPQE